MTGFEASAVTRVVELRLSRRPPSFTVNSDSSITATAPASTMFGLVDVVVANAVNASALSSADRFTYKQHSTTTASVSTDAPAQGDPVTYSATVTGDVGSSHRHRHLRCRVDFVVLPHWF